MLADSHVHLDRYTDAEVAALLRRAHETGVTRLLTVGVDLTSSARAIQLARQHPGLSAAVGLHPAYLGAAFSTSDPSSYRERLRPLAIAPEVVAIGEAGIDLVDAQAPLDIQRVAFRLQLELAGELNRPLILHHQGKQAELHCQALLQEMQQEREQTDGWGILVIVHYFVGDLASATRWLDLGCALSVGRPVTRPENAALRAAIAAIPMECLLLETDTYPLPGRTTEPAHILQIAQAVADIKHLPIETIAEQTTANFCRLLRVTD